MKEKVEFRKVSEFGEIIADTFQFIKQNFKPLLKAVIYLSGVFIIAGMISSILTQVQIQELTQNFDNGTYSDQTDRWNLLFTLRYILFTLFMVLNFTAMYVSILSFVALYIRKGNIAPNIEEVWSYFKYYFLRVFLSSLVVIPFVMLGFLCCGIPGIYIFPIMLLFFPVMILENGSFSHSFERAFRIVKNEWWITAVTVLVIFIITAICTTILQLPSLFIMMISSFTNGAKINSWYEIATAVLLHLAQLFFIIPIVASAFLYSNLVERKESIGLMERIESLGNTPHQTHHHEEEY